MVRGAATCSHPSRCVLDESNPQLLSVFCGPVGELEALKMKLMMLKICYTVELVSSSTSCKCRCERKRLRRY